MPSLVQPALSIKAGKEGAAAKLAAAASLLPHDLSLNLHNLAIANHQQQQPLLRTDAEAYAVMATRLDVSPDRDDDSRSSSTSGSPAPVDNEESDFFLGANDSQSSLGVVNFQDMQVLDDACWPPVNRLPNEILICIFAKLSASSDLFRAMLVCKRWTRNAVDLLWHRPACTSWKSHENICQTLGSPKPFFNYRDFVKRLNLASLARDVNDGSVLPLAVCTRVERLTLTNCTGLTDTGLIALLENNASLLALDVSNDRNITEKSIKVIAEVCKRLQGLNISGCTGISNDSLVTLAENCRFIKRLKLNDCTQIRDYAVSAFAENCPNILEIDLQQCAQITNAPITSLMARGNCLRELRLASCDLIDDAAFLSLPPGKTFDHLRILDLTNCSRLTDAAVTSIIESAPRLRNLVLAKCRNITDVAVHAISKLGKNLHYVHLGHCAQITDDGVKKLVSSCSRIRYIDLGCCTNLTDESVKRLALLPKLKRIGLVKCNSITDESIFTLAEVARKPRLRRDSNGLFIGGEYYSSSLERVHLSYCTNLTLKSIMKLLNSCPRLTHLSLTGVAAFQREDFAPFCRTPPAEFNQHQRDVFCVFSGGMVSRFRDFLNTSPLFEQIREPFVAVRAGRPRGSIGSRRFSAGVNPIPPFDDMYDFEGNAEANGEVENYGPTSTQHPVYQPGPAEVDTLDLANDQMMQNFGAGVSPPIFGQVNYGGPSATPAEQEGLFQGYNGPGVLSTFMTNDPAVGAPPLSAFGHTQASMAGVSVDPASPQASAAGASSAVGASTAVMHLQPPETRERQLSVDEMSSEGGF